MSISLIIPAYVLNQDLLDTTNRLLASLATDPPYELLLVDNGSPYPPARSLPAAITLEENQGYAGGVNAGLKEATCDILVIGNNDLVFPDKWTQEVEDYFQTNHALTFRLSNDHENDHFTSCWAISRQVYEELGPLDPTFPNAFADTDYERRVKQAGYDIGLSTVIIHHEAASTHKVLKKQGIDDFHQAIRRFEEKWGDLG